MNGTPPGPRAAKDRTLMRAHLGAEFEQEAGGAPSRMLRTCKHASTRACACVCVRACACMQMPE
eukprot:10051045-Alexandrium_andersonii.AAC.1